MTNGLTSLARMLCVASCLYALFAERRTSEPTYDETVVRLYHANESSGHHFTITTFRLDPKSKYIINGQECYTNWREDIVRTTPEAKYVNVTYYEHGRVHRFAEPAAYRFEFDKAPAMNQDSYWEGQCVRSERWETPRDDVVHARVKEADLDEMYRLCRELGVEL